MSMSLHAEIHVWTPEGDTDEDAFKVRLEAAMRPLVDIGCTWETETVEEWDNEG